MIVAVVALTAVIVSLRRSVGRGCRRTATAEISV
jgi:hypothetical protein